MNGGGTATADGGLGLQPLPQNLGNLGAPPDRQISGTFQIILALYILLTGTFPTIVQAMAYGIDGGAGSNFSVAMASEIVRDLVLLAPVIMLSNHPLGILHPLLLGVVIWPFLSTMPAVVQDFAGWGGVFLGEPVAAPYFEGLPGRSPSDVWFGIAKYNALDVLRILAVYAGFAASKARLGMRRSFAIPNPSSVRVAMLLMLAAGSLVLLFFVRSRGGVIEHLGSLGRGRFRELGGQGIFIVAIHLQAIALYVWVAARPKDVKSPFFLALLVFVVASQFVKNGSRAEALTVPMMVGLVWALRVHKIPWRVAAIGAPLLFISLGLLGAVRNSSWSRETATEAIASTGLSQSFENAQTEIQERRSLQTSVPIIERSFDLSGPMMGTTYIPAVLGIVPRAVWSNKPRGPDSLYAQIFLHETSTGRGIPVGQTEELFWNFGVFGVVLFGLIYGWVLTLAYSAYLKRYPSPIAIVFYALFVTRFQFATEMLVTLEQQMLLLLLCAILISALPKVRLAVTPQQVRPVGNAGSPQPATATAAE